MLHVISTSVFTCLHWHHQLRVTEQMLHVHQPITIHHQSNSLAQNHVRTFRVPSELRRSVVGVHRLVELVLTVKLFESHERWKGAVLVETSYHLSQ